METVCMGTVKGLIDTRYNEQILKKAHTTIYIY